MSYLAFCTFDLKGATSSDYQTAYADLEKIGLRRVHKGTSRNVVIPTTSVMGDFPGTGVDSVRDWVREQVSTAFKRRGFKSEIFVVVGSNATWGSTTT